MTVTLTNEQISMIRRALDTFGYALKNMVDLGASSMEEEIDGIRRALNRGGNAEPGLRWMTPMEGRKNTYGKLYLAYQPGHPLMIADWRTGIGYRDVRTSLSIDPTRVAYINMPADAEFAVTPDDRDRCPDD